MSEHELFEYNFPKPKDIYWCEELNDYNYIDRGRGNPYAYDNLISYRLAWKVWQVSVNRQGYKLVPIEPTYDMYDAFYKEHDKYEDGDVKPFKESYKAMIGVAE